MFCLIARCATFATVFLLSAPDVQGQHMRHHQYPNQHHRHHSAALPAGGYAGSVHLHSRHQGSNYGRPITPSSRYRSGVMMAPGIGGSYYGTAYYGYGYAYDPYRSGNFEAPDLLDDPFFRAQHKFDSHYPGRYSGPRSARPPLQFCTQ